MKAKVSIVRCRGYDRGEVQIAVEKALGLLGGIGIFIKKGEKVLIKPNMLSARPPEDGVCTHLEIIRQAVRLVRDCGALPFIADNPGGSMNPRKLYEGSGLMALAKEEGVELKEVKDIKVVKNLPFASYVFECDKIISLPKMKTHSLMGLTGAIKNMYGAVAGLHKSELHKRFPGPQEFAKVLVDTFEIAKPHLVLMDGVIAMDRDGPSSGRLREVGLLIAGQDSVAIDSIFSRLIGINPNDVLTTKEAYHRKLGEANLENIEILGERIEENLIEDFEIPRKTGIINMLGPTAKLIARLVKFGPSIDEKLCEKCRICQDTCPVAAITIDSKKSFIDLKRCIRCMCCHEVCPYRAVVLKRNILAKRFGL